MRRTSKPVFTVCEVGGCGKPVRYRTQRYCNAHYNRMWRKGSTEDRPHKETLEHVGGYILDRCPGHPLATSGAPRYVYQHRRVFFDAKGGGPFACHVCGGVVTWADMHVDHLDDDPANNEIGNLAPACPTCNQLRGREKMRATRRSQGRLYTINGETLCLTEWAERLGINRSAIRGRIKAGWPIERALTERRLGP